MRSLAGPKMRFHFRNKAYPEGSAGNYITFSRAAFFYKTAFEIINTATRIKRTVRNFSTTF